MPAFEIENGRLRPGRQGLAIPHSMGQVLQALERQEEDDGMLTRVVSHLIATGQLRLQQGKVKFRARAREGES